jgi:hypothetical protein
VSIIKDNWIPGYPAGTFTPLSPIPSTAKVRFLMNDSGTEWEVDTVRAFFHTEIAETILNVPISKHGGEDFVSWMHDKHGQYTVRSAYNLARTASFFSDTGAAGRGSCSDRDTETKLWKTVWAIQAPNKMKVVLWSVIHDCLPTCHQLVHRHIPADDRCRFYGQLERVEHLFILCPFTRAIWEVIKEQFRLRLCRKNLVNIKQWMSEFLKRESETSATVLAVTCWHVWEARNELRNDDVQIHPARVTAKVLAYVDMILAYMFKEKAVMDQSTASMGVRWVPPLENLYL